MLKNKTIVLGITGCIAAYKAPDIARGLIKLGAKVIPVMTQAASQFITPLTMQSITSQKVVTSLFDNNDDNFAHINLANIADLVLIAPCTANTIAKIANGIADNALSSLVLATRAPVVIAAAMNHRMYSNSFTQENITKLKALPNLSIIDPEAGELACGEVGKGRLAAVENIIEDIVATLTKNKDLLGKKVLVTAGGTRENIDPIRFIGNRSSGKMGYACAAEFALRGASVKLISANSDLEKPAGVEVIEVESAKELREQVLSNFRWADAVIMSAAVGDFRPEKPVDTKIKKEGNFNLDLVQNADILAELGKNKGNKVLIGFAAETGDPVESAKKKLASKNLNFILANDVSKSESGIGKDSCDLIFISKDETQKIGLLEKERAAVLIADKLINLFKQATV